MPARKIEIKSSDYPELFPSLKGEMEMGGPAHRMTEDVIRYCVLCQTAAWWDRPVAFGVFLALFGITGPFPWMRKAALEAPTNTSRGSCRVRAKLSSSSWWH